MFKKEGSEISSAQPRSAQSKPGARAPASHTGGGVATIGPSITIKGNVTGDEDLVIQGQIDGKVKLGKHNVTIGSDGRVKADVHGRTVVVEGEVEGDLRAQEQIVLRRTAKVIGSIAAPRVTLEDGAVFRGAIEMDASPKTPQQGREKVSAKNEVTAPKDDEKAGDGGSDPAGASTRGPSKTLSA